MVFLILVIEIVFVNTVLSKEPEVMFLDIQCATLEYAKEVELASDLLGVKVKTHLIEPKIGNSKIELDDAEAVILTERVLKYISTDMISKRWSQDKKLNVLVLGINSDTDIQKLSMWSDGIIRKVRRVYSPSGFTWVKVIKNSKISLELGGLEYPLIKFSSKMIDGFEFDHSSGSERLIEVVDEGTNIGYPVFVKTESAGRNVFLLSSWKELFGKKGGPLEIMPILMFIKASLGDRCWHSIRDYANLTIDDPWLREPYGYIRFGDLCREAEKVGFHVTIGFIPFNHRKSQRDATQVFLKCSGRLSISVHGNNHDFSEFRSKESNRVIAERGGEMVPGEKSILQAVHRMEEFGRATKLSWDRVMIFPRGVFTKENLGLLKKHNFLMTVNSTGPSNAGGISDHVDRIRGITFEFGNFPMLIRDGISGFRGDKRAVAIAEASMRMRLFLDLPVLLYTHHTYFKDGMDKLNLVAGTVNRIQPDVVWAGLGDVANHLYLQKKINEREVEILAFSSELVVENRYDVPIRFVIRKQEDFVVPIQAVAVDGIEHEYGSDDNHIRIAVTIEPGGRKTVSITYDSGRGNGISFHSDRSVHAFFVRILSDFRDIYLSKLPFGDRIVDGFYWVGGIRNSVIGLVGLAAVLLIVFALCRKMRSKNREIHRQSSLEP